MYKANADGARVFRFYYTFTLDTLLHNPIHLSKFKRAHWQGSNDPGLQIFALAIQGKGLTLRCVNQPLTSTTVPAGADQHFFKGGHAHALRREKYHLTKADSSTLFYIFLQHSDFVVSVLVRHLRVACKVEIGKDISLG